MVLQSRFIVQNDPKSERFLFDLPGTWWSRFYEYEWAKNFAAPGEVVLDAACGICHPLKFYLSDVCGEVHACDFDRRIVSNEHILKDIESDFGKEAAQNFPEKYFENVRYAVADLSLLPYENEKFDKIFCISVLEHLDFSTMMASFKQFSRCLKKDGLVIVTFDYPNIDFKKLSISLKASGLEFADEAFFDLPDNAIYTDYYGPRLNCFRAVLKKK